MGRSFSVVQQLAVDDLRPRLDSGHAVSARGFVAFRTSATRTARTKKLAPMPLLELDKLTMQFGGLTAIKQLDLRVEPGVVFSIIGPNGAGKTTVFNAITGIYEPTSGSIQFENQPLRKALRWKAIAVFLAFGLLAGAAAAFLSVDLD